MKSKIIVDSCLDFNDEVFGEKSCIERVPFKISFGNNEIIDDGSFSMHDFICKMQKHNDRIFTSCPSPEDFLKTIDPQAHNYIITISSRLSGSYKSAMAAKNLATLSQGATVTVIDSKSAAAGQDILAFKLIEMIKSKLSHQKIISKIETFTNNMKTRFVLNSFENLIKNGRMQNIVATISKLLNIVPIMCDNSEGEIALKEKVRGKEKALIRLKNIIEKEALEKNSDILGITHVNCKEIAKKLKTELIRKNIFKNIIIFDAGGLSTIYADNGGIVVAY